MKLDNLTYWRTSGTPDVFTETRDGEEWLVIDSDKAYTAGFSQVVYFDKPIKAASLSVVASLYTNGGGLMLRLGVHPSGLTPLWSGWYGPDNGWSGTKAQVLRFIARDLNAISISVSLEGRALRPPRWPAKNTCRWRDVQIEVEYTGQEPEPPEPPTPPELPDPDPDTPESIRVLQQAMVLSSQLLEQAGKMTVAIGQVLALFDQKPEV